MQITRHYAQCPPFARGCVIALGNFDGLHLGHQEVIHTARRIADEKQVPCAVMTFEPHPRSLLRPESALPPILPLSEKLRLMKNLGVEYLFLQRFTEAFSRVTAGQFVISILKGTLLISEAVTGHDFAFGQGRAGTAEYLAQAARAQGFSYTRVPPVEVEGAPCSSTRLREALSQGNMEMAGRLLGRDYEMRGRVQHGEGRGVSLGYPTANLSLEPIFVPAEGIYAVQAQVEGAGGWRGGVAYLGRKEMFGDFKRALEVHLFGFAGDFYGRKMRVRLLHRLRGDQIFSASEVLKAQMDSDAEAAQLWLSMRTREKSAGKAGTP